MRSHVKPGGDKIVARNKLPIFSMPSRIRAIGNSRGVILSNQVIEEAGIQPEADIIIQARSGMITIFPAKSKNRVNLDLSTWGKQFKSAIKAGQKPEHDLWEGIGTDFDKEDWK